MILIILSAAIFLFWCFTAIDFIQGVYFKIPLLKKQNPPVFPDCFPKVSIIFSARNEESQVAAALQTMLSQDYPDYEVIAINDRSTDATLEKMKALAPDPRLKIINIQELPQGWLGKNHALQKGADQASGDWLLFTDADIHFEPETLKYAVGLAEAGKFDHIALLPKMVRQGFLETIYSVCFGVGFFIYFQPWKASDPNSKSHIGMGAFNLVRRSAYQKIGGHKALALSVVDDMELGRRVKEAGFRQTAVFGREFLSVQWVEGWQGILKSLEKNGFAGVEYRTGFLFISTLITTALNLLPFIFIFALHGPAQIFSAASLLMIFLIYIAIQKFTPRSLWVFPFHGLGCLLVSMMLCRSALLALRQGGIQWRDTFYSLKELKNQ